MDKPPIEKRGETFPWEPLLLLCGHGCGSLIAYIRGRPPLGEHRLYLARRVFMFVSQGKDGVFRWLDRGTENRHERHSQYRRAWAKVDKASGGGGATFLRHYKVPRAASDLPGEPYFQYRDGLPAEDYPTWRVACRQCQQITTINPNDYRSPPLYS